MSRVLRVTHTGNCVMGALGKNAVHLLLPSTTEYGGACPTKARAARHADATTPCADERTPPPPCTTLNPHPSFVRSK